MVHISALRYLLRYHGSAGDCAASADAHSVRFMIPRVGESDSRLIAHCHLPPCWQSATDRGVSRAGRRFGIAGSALAMGHSTTPCSFDGGAVDYIGDETGFP